MSDNIRIGTSFKLNLTNKNRAKLKQGNKVKTKYTSVQSVQSVQSNPATNTKPHTIT